MLVRCASSHPSRRSAVGRGFQPPAVLHLPDDELGARGHGLPARGERQPGRAQAEELEEVASPHEPSKVVTPVPGGHRSETTTDSRFRPGEVVVHSATMLELMQRWLTTAEHLAGRFPSAAAQLDSWPAALLVGLAGVALLIAGIRLGRILAAGGSAAIGYLAGLALAPGFDLWNLPAATPAFAAAAVLGLLALASPELYPVMLGLVPGALLGSRISLAGSAWLGAAAGGLVLALLAVLLRRIVLAATAAAAGAALVATALLALSRLSPALAMLGQRPKMVAGLAVLLAVASTAFQVSVSRRVAPSSAFGLRGGSTLRD